MIKLQYIGGPLDGDTEVRTTSPRIGEMVHRFVRDRYCSYQWDGSRFVHTSKR